MSRAISLSLACMIFLIAAREDARSEEAGARPAATAKDLNAKLDEVRVPAMEFSAITFVEAVGRVHEAANKQVNLVVKCDPDEISSRVTVSLPAGTLRDALSKLAAAAGVKMQVDPHSVSFLPKSK